jgi:hypothetical protein
MNIRTTLLLALALLPACASLDQSDDRDRYAERMKPAADAYTACVVREVEKDAKNAAGAEDIAIAAHGRCWAEWEAYRKVALGTYSAGASTRDERQFAADKTEAHLRQFERETRQAAVSRIVESSLTRKP